MCRYYCYWYTTYLEDDDNDDEDALALSDDFLYAAYTMDFSLGVTGSWLIQSIATRMRSG
jgi:hypothetical protein